MKGFSAAVVFGALVIGTAAMAAPGPPAVSGIYPHLATFNDEGECGTGAVVPWADRLWVISYGPHLPLGSSDKLYEITPELRQIVRPESVGGTPANRMIHRESGQLLIGPYSVDSNRNVRVIAPTNMPGRLTGTARHLSDPAHKVYYATMEEGLYEVDVRTLEVWGRIKDGNGYKAGQTAEQHPATIYSKLPGYHGKGLYSGQGRLVYANNGEQSSEALVNPNIASGALAEWRGSGDWELVRRNQFTEVTGPGGIYGNAHPETDPVWSVGWDARSVILILLDKGQWHSFRLPKASHCYDGAHGWNTEWPRIRDIGRPDKPELLMTMHGMFWEFPLGFSVERISGIRPRSTYLKVIGDFCRWNDRVVFGCDDSAKSEFLNKRKAKGTIQGPGQSQSNLWFVDPDDLDEFGPALGRGAVWLDDNVKAGATSEPFLVSGFRYRQLLLAHDSPVPVTFTLEADVAGKAGQWRAVERLVVPAQGSVFVDLSGERANWVRLSVDRDCTAATAFFQLRNKDGRGPKAKGIFAGLAQPGDKDVTGGFVYARGANLRSLRLISRTANGEASVYEMGADLQLRRTNDPSGIAWANKFLAVPNNVLTVDAASVLYVDEHGKRWRLPKGDAAFDAPGALADERIDREVCTERDLFNCHGTFYELPAENAGGFAKIRPIATHNRRISDYCSYRGMLIMTGVKTSAKGEHILRSADGQGAVWAGAVDDLWKLGKPRGHGGPWHDTAVKAGEPSDPYLIAGYDRKSVVLSHSSRTPVAIRLEADVTGTGKWVSYKTFVVAPGKKVAWRFPESFGAYWIRAVAERDARATVEFEYE